jgi:hypothetical protein
VGEEDRRGGRLHHRLARDWAFHEWNNKPVAFVSYGGVGGTRGVEQLRLVAIEVHPELFKPLETGADRMLDQLLWWAKPLKTARIASMTT